MALTVLSKTFPITAGKSYVGQTRPSSGGGGSVSWVPPSGYFADIPMLNNAADAAPSIYSAGSMNDTFNKWGGSDIVYDYGPLGAHVYRSGGHSPGQEDVLVNLICDYASLTWKAANSPVLTYGHHPDAGNEIDPNTGCFYVDGMPGSPHVYLGLHEFPTAWGGGPKGSIVQMFYAGSPIKNRVYSYDLSQVNFGHAVINTTQAQNAQPTLISFYANGGASAGAYPAACKDYQKQGWWITLNGGFDYTLFLSKNGTITQYQALGGNNQEPAITVAPALDLVIVIDGGYTSGDYVSNSHNSLYIRNRTTGVTTTATTTGPIGPMYIGYDGVSPYFTPGKGGYEWVEELGCIVGLDESTTPPTVRKLTPPATNPATGVWTWSAISLQHWPSDVGGSPTLKKCVNNVWSKFRWNKQIHAFDYCVSSTDKPQVISI